MLFKAFWLALPRPERDPFAKRCETTEGHLNNVAYCGKPCAAHVAVNIERESGGKVRAEELCPKVDWGYIRGTRAGRRSLEHRSA